MKKKLLILAAVAVSGLAAVVASNTNKMFGDSDADAVLLEIFCGNDVYDCYSGGNGCLAECYELPNATLGAIGRRR